MINPTEKDQSMLNRVHWKEENCMSLYSKYIVIYVNILFVNILFLKKLHEASKLLNYLIFLNSYKTYVYYKWQENRLVHKFIKKFSLQSIAQITCKYIIKFKRWKEFFWRYKVSCSPGYKWNSEMETVPVMLCYF